MDTIKLEITPDHNHLKKQPTIRLAVMLAVGAACGGRLLAQTPIPATYALPLSAADTNQPGFIWNVSQVANHNDGTVAWAELQLAGQEGANMADPTAVGPATGPASPANPATAPITFFIPSVINLNIVAGGTSGNFTPDDQMPGIPGGAGNGTDNTGAEILTYLYLPAGLVNMGVNSDDGFRVTLGGSSPLDRFAPVVGVFDGTRGPANSEFQIQVPQAGLYAARCLYYNQGGGAEVEWYTIFNATNRVLINDLANGGVPAYRVVNQTNAYFQSVDPTPSAAGVSPSEGVHLVLVDGSTPISPGSILLALDGVPAGASVNKTGAVTTVDYILPTIWTSLSSHTGVVAYVEGTAHYTNTWTWTVQYYTSLDASWRVNSVDTSKPGFNWNIFANSDPANNPSSSKGNAANNNQQAEVDLTLQAVDATGATLPNIADPSAVNGATGAATAPNPANAPIHFEVPGTINFDALTNMPGSPSIDTTTDGQAGEVVTYLSLPTGTLTMQIDAKDGWRLYSGTQPADVFSRAVVAENNSRGGVVKFGLIVPQAGIYPFRLVWQNSTGTGSHLDWYNLNNSGNAVLVNDLANGGFPAYRALTSSTTVPPAVVGATPLVGYQQQKLAYTNLFLVLADGTHPINDASVTLAVDGKPVPSASLVTQRQNNYLTISDGGAAFPGLQLQGDVHLGVLTYSDSTGTYSRTQEWNFVNIQVLQNVPANPVVSENFDSYSEATSSANTVPPGWHAWDFTAVNTPGWNITDKASDSFKDWIIISSDTLTTSIEPGSATYDMTQTVNGAPVASFFSGNVLWATSDGRDGPQAQFCISAPFNLSSVTNPVMLFSSIIEMSAEANAQSDGIEYSIDGGTTWYPGIIYVTIAHHRPDYIFLTPSGDIDVARTLNPPFIALQNLYGTWTDPGPGPFTGQVRGNTYASALAEPATQALAPHLAIRDDDSATSAKVDGIRLPKASRQSSVILRFYQLGSCSWWWGVDNLAFYDAAPPYVVPTTTPPHIDSISAKSGQVTIKWSNGGTLFSSPSLQNPAWTSTGNSSGTFTGPVNPGNQFYRVQQ